MKKIGILLGLGILFFSISFCSNFVKEENILPVVSLDQDQSYYEVDVSELGITTTNLIERFPEMQVVRIYPNFSKIYRDRIEQKYYQVNNSKTLLENCNLMQERYLFLLGFYGFVHDKQQYEIYGVPISKIVVLASHQEIETTLSGYNVKETVLE